MTYLDHYRTGHLVLPSALLYHCHQLFSSSDAFVVWQFFFLQEHKRQQDLTPSQIAQALGKSLADVNRLISELTEANLLDMRTIELDGEIEMLFDPTPALARLDDLLRQTDQESKDPETKTNRFKELVQVFEQELGRFLSPFELEDLQKLVDEDKVDMAIIKEALREAVFNGKTNWNYIQAILRNWRKEGIVTLRQVEERRRDRQGTTLQKTDLPDDFLSAVSLWND